MSPVWEWVCLFSYQHENVRGISKTLIHLRKNIGPDDATQSSKTPKHSRVGSVNNQLFDNHQENNYRMQSVINPIGKETRRYVKFVNYRSIQAIHRPEINQNQLEQSN